MKQINKNDCEAEICNREHLNTTLGFMSKEDITTKCKCENASICKQIVDLLNNNKRKEAQDIIDKM